MVTRRDLRAERDFYSPMTGDKSSTYGSQVKNKLANIKNVKSTRTKPIEAVFAKLLKTADPFTQIEEKKSYAPQEDNDIKGQIEGAVGAAQDAIGQGVSKVKEFAKSTGQRASERRAEQQLKRQEERAADKADFDRQLGDFKSEMGTQSSRLAENNRLLSGMRTDRDQYRKTQSDKIQNIANTFDTRYKVLGERVDKQEKKVSTMGTTITGIGTREFTRQFSAKQTEKKATPKQTVASLPSNYKETEAKAFAQAKAYQQAKNNPNTKAGVDSKGQVSVKAANNSGVARAQAAAIARKVSGRSISQTKAANNASMRANAAARNASFQAQKKAGTHSVSSRTAAGQRARNKAAAKNRAKAAAKRRNKSKKSKKCDITIKYDISLLTNNNLRHDELADVAYFVRALNEVEL